MATIPGPQSFGGRPSLRTNRPVTQDNSAEIVAGGIADFGEASQRTGAAVQTRQDDFAIKVAQQDFYQLDDKVRREVQELDDYNKWDEEYKNRMAVGLDPIASSIRGSQNQTLFRESAETTIGQGSGIIFGEAFKREAQDGRAKTNEKLSALRESFLTETNPDIRTRNLESALGLIKAAEKNGYIDADDAQKARQDLSQNWALGWIEMRDTKEAVSILEASLNGGGAATSIPGIPHSDTVLKHSQDMIDTGLARENKDGTGSTFVGTVVNWEEINDGRASVIPSYINGKQYDYRKKEDRDEAMPYLLSKQWPSADTVEEAEQMEQTIHVEMAKQKSTKTGTPADLIPVDKRKAMLEKLKEFNKVDTVRQDSQRFAASVNEQFPDDPEAQRKWVRANVKDAETQDETIRRIDNRVNQRASDEKLLNDDTFQGLGDAVLKGDMSFDDITPVQLEILTVSQQKTLKALEDDRWSPKETDWGEWTNLKVEMSNMTREQISAIQPMSYRLLLADQQYIELLNTVTKAKNNEAYQVHNNSTAWQKMNQLTGGKMNTLGGAVLNKMFSIEAAALEATQESPLTDQQQMEILARISPTLNVTDAGWFYFDKEMPAYQIKPEQIPSKDRQNIEAALKARGVPVTNVAIVQAYIMRQRQLQYGK